MSIIFGYSEPEASDEDAGLSEAPALRSWHPENAGSRRPRSSGSQRQNKGLGEQRRNWFDMEPPDWVERRRRCPRPESAPANRMDYMYHRENFPQKVRELIVSRRAEQDRVRWIDRLTDVQMLRPERQDKFSRAKVKAERNIAKLEEELGKIAVGCVKTKPKPKNPESFQVALPEQKATLSPSDTPTSQAFNVYIPETPIIKSYEVGLDKESWLLSRLHPEWDPEKAEKDSRSAFRKQASSKPPGGATSQLRTGGAALLQPIKRESNLNDPGQESGCMDDSQGSFSPTGASTSKLSKKGRRARDPGPLDGPEASAPIGRRAPKSKLSRHSVSSPNLSGLGTANSSSKLRPMSDLDSVEERDRAASDEK